MKIFIRAVTLVTGIVSASTLIGCSESGRAPEQLEGQNIKRVYLGSGIKVTLGENETGTVFGYDSCPQKDRIWVFGATELESGCTLLTGKSSISVRLILSDGSLTKESWRVFSAGDSGNGYRLVRSTGWIVGQYNSAMQR